MNDQQKQTMKILKKRLSDVEITTKPSPEWEGTFLVECDFVHRKWFLMDDGTLFEDDQLETLWINEYGTLYR